MRSNVEEQRVVASGAAHGSVGATWSPVRSGASLLLAAMSALAVLTVRADVAPPVSIKMRADAPMAISGEVYAGVFEVELGHAGTMQEFEIVGEGWEILEAEFPEGGYYVEPGSFLIPFKARPVDADARIELRLIWDFQIVRRSFSIGPEVFAKRDQVLRAASRPGSIESPEDGTRDETDSGTLAGGTDVTLRFEGRIVYDRAGRDENDDGDFLDEKDIPPLDNVGVEGISWKIVDIDLDGEETIDSGWTDADGKFDTGNLDWDDCDVTGCDDPDLVLRFWTDNGKVSVEHGNGGFVPYYSWSTTEIEDFTGSYKNFGDVAPIFLHEHPALHIHNSIERTHRFILTEAETFVPKVTVVWPDPDGAETGAHYHSETDEIHISTERQWWEATHSHEYGHHYLSNFSNTIPPDYCNNFCDGIKTEEEPCAPGTMCESPTHCRNCPENDHDAWNEGWPNWLADVTTRWMEETLTNQDGSDYEVLYKRSQESVGSCCQDGTFYDSQALDVEGFVGALLRDIEDSNFDFHSWNLDDNRVQRDSLCLGVDEIFDTVSVANPVTVEAFQNAFIARYPEHVAALRHTSVNVAPLYLSAPNFPTDTQPMGPVISAQSITHAPGQGGSLPCVVMAWDPPDDDVNGACDYSYAWGPTSDVQASDFENDVDSIGCQLSAKGEVDWIGDVYFGIRAAECGSGLGDTAVFGPFEVADCNANGSMDLCDISCSHTGDEEIGCTVDSLFCNGQPNCGTSGDCNGNLIPDECDVASGASRDCNENNVPDDCELMKNWAGGTGQWVTPGGWVEGSIPVSGEHVCIEDTGGAVTVAYTSGDTTVPILASSESLDIANATTWPISQLTLQDTSWVDGDLTLRNPNSVLSVENRLDIGGQFTWIGENNSTTPKLTGAGETHVFGGLNIPSSIVSLADHDVVLEPGSNSLVLGRIDSSSASSVTIRPGAVLDYQGTQHLINGSGASLIVEGTLTKSVYTGTSNIAAPTQNDGLIHVQDGTLAFLAASTTTGDILGDPLTTVEFGCGGHELMPSSSVVADRVSFTGANCGARNVRGTYDVAAQTAHVSTSQLTFTNEADIVSYGTNLFLANGTTTFDAVVGAPMIFDNITAGSRVYFNSGDPIITNDLILGGNVYGPSPITVNGTLTWPAGTSFYGPGVVTSNGTLFVEAGGSQKKLYGRQLNIAGHAIFDGGIALFGVAGEINVVGGGLMDIRLDDTVLAGVGTSLNNAATIVKAVGEGTSLIQSTTTNTGLIEIQTGTLAFRYFTQTSGEIKLFGGDFAMSQISSPQPLVLAGGSLKGAGAITGVVNNTGGSVEPGFSAGTITMSHDYNQVAPGQLVAEIGGLTPGTEYDQLVLTGGAASFGGTLRVEFIDGFVPEFGATFDVVVALSSSGMFTTVEVNGLQADRGIRVVDNTAGIRLQVFDPACDGIVGSLALCPNAICPEVDYSLGQDPTLSFTRADLCPAGGVLPGAVDFVEGRISALAFDAGNVRLGIVTPAACGNTLDAFLWDSPPPVTGEVHFLLARPQGASDYGTASSTEPRTVTHNDCP